MHREYIRVNTKITHTIWTWSLLVFFQRSCNIISNLNDFLMVSFHTETDSVITDQSNTVWLCTRCIIQKSFSQDVKVLR